MVLLEQPKINVDELAHKITQFEDKKRQKIQFLKEEKEQKEVEECKFVPQLMTKKKHEVTRNLDQFLEDQKRYEELKKQKQQERLEENVKSQMSQTLRGPYINEKSKRLLEQRQNRDRVQSIQREEGGIIDSTKSKNLNSNVLSANKNKENTTVNGNTSVTRPSNLQSKTLLNSAQKECSFQPQITKMSKNMVRDKPVQDHLYEEAFRRKVKLQEKEKEIYKPVQKQINKETEKYVVQRFVREFQQCIMDLFQSENTPKNINYYNMKQLLVMMGFCSEQAANSDSNERVLLYDIWRILEGDQREEVTVEDVKTLLMGIVKITEFKRINAVPNEEE